MPDRVFIDTNLWIYLFLNSKDSIDQQKRLVVKRLLQDYPDIVVSTQVLNETANVLLKKYHVDQNQIECYLQELLNIAELSLLDEQTTFDALHLLDRYHLSFFDALIISSAKDTNCALLFSEDMQDGQKIDDILKIINPLKS